MCWDLELGAWDLRGSLDISPRRLSSIRPSRSPSEPRRPRVRAALDDIGDERAQDGRELEPVTAVACGNDQARAPGIVIDQEISVEAVAVEAKPGLANRRICQSRQLLAKELADPPLVISGNRSRGIRIHRMPAAVMTDLQGAV